MNTQKGNTSVIVSLVIVLCFIGLIVYIFMSKKEDNLSTIQEVNSNTTVKPITNNVVEPIKKETNTTKDTTMDPNKRVLQNFTVVSKVPELKKIDLVVGTGNEVKTGDTVSVHYTGAIASTGVVFQSSKDFGTAPITFPLAGVIKGWTDGIPGMKIGGTRRLIIPSVQAYGATPPPGSGIPANADLVFDVELVGIK